MASGRNSDLEETMSRKLRTTMAMLLLTLALGTGAAQALPFAEEPAAVSAFGAFTVAWEWLTSLFAVETSAVQVPLPGGNEDPLPGAVGDGGAFIDPNGES